MDENLIRRILAAGVILPQLRMGDLARKRGYRSLCWILAAWPVALPVLFLCPDLRMATDETDVVVWERRVNAVGLLISGLTVSTLALVAYNLPAVLRALGVV